MKQALLAILTFTATVVLMGSASATGIQKTYQDIGPLPNNEFCLVKEVIVDPAIGGCRVAALSAETKQMQNYDVAQDAASAPLCQLFINALGSQKKVVIWWKNATIRGKDLRFVKRVNYLAE
ncbi:MAG: hypothetical protein WC956_08710 [bacterium]